LINLTKIDICYRLYLDASDLTTNSNLLKVKL